MTAVRLLLPQGGLRRWHRQLVDRLVAHRHRAFVEVRARRGAAPPSTALIEALEDLIARPRPPASLNRAPPGAWSAPDAGVADLVVDLTGSADPEPGAIVPLYDGAAGDAARDAALLDHRAPWIELAAIDADAPRVFASALPALPRPDLLCAGRAAVADALTALILRLAARGLGEASASRPPAATQRAATTRFAAAALAGRVERRLRQLLVRDDHWRIAVRRRTADDALFAGLDDLGDPSWRWLADDRRRYFADPFLFEADGVAYVFCEEFPYATGKGVISVFALDADGAPGAPQIVLERPYHLSYPFVFRHDGAIWMMPESGANRTLELYRADPFPLRWTLDRTLFSDVALADATPFACNSEWWLTATLAETEGASWDSLALFSGPGPLGPWTPTGDGPALIDAAAARPAGRVFEHQGALIRPAQDCRGGYGAGLTFRRIEALGPGLFRQTPIPEATAMGGLHTFNQSACFTTIDAAGPRARSNLLAGFSR